MNIALIGYGKMGKAIEEIALQKGHEIVLKIDVENQHDLTIENLQKADVAIEFTGPENALNNINKCIDANIPVVSGSTGWLQHWPEVEKYCREKNGTLLYASNFSIGVNIFFEVNKRLAALISKQPAYDVTIEEIHHTAKKDSPSGTAITLAEQIIKEIPRKSTWINEPSTNDEALVINSIRMDPAPGTHTVKYSSGVDDIAITHTAHNRKGFAGGAILAAEFLQRKKGIFHMKDVLGFS
jgi:4-hydroxy-tetrahydrodipicolinate reductase